MDTNNLSNLAVTPLLIDAALTVINRWGSEVLLEQMPGPVIVWEQASFEIFLTTPKTMAPGMLNAFNLEIWVLGKDAFSACWTSLERKDYGSISMTRGPWVQSLMKMAGRCSMAGRTATQP
jgi:hypothetical protein